MLWSSLTNRLPVVVLVAGIMYLLGAGVAVILAMVISSVVAYISGYAVGYVDCKDIYAVIFRAIYESPGRREGEEDDNA